MGFIQISEQTATWPCTTLTDWFCVTDVESVYCALGIESLYKTDMFLLSWVKSSFKGLSASLHQCYVWYVPVRDARVTCSFSGVPTELLKIE